MVEVKLLKMSIKNFKGITDLEIDFTGKTIISGKNASGKSTIASAYFWLLANKDINLVDNPNVKPINVEECSPTVSATFDINGKTVELTKIQTITVKTNDDGIVKSSTKNSYMVNSVPVIERDFLAKLSELELPSIDKLLMCSHTDVFVNQKTADMRNFLFGMASERTDLDIANSLGNVPEVVSLLGNYTLAEIEAMNKATVKKCKEQGESIPSQIEGLEAAKVNADASEFESAKAEIKEQIAKEQKIIEDLTTVKEKSVHLMTEGLRLEFDVNEELRKMHEQETKGAASLETEATNLYNKKVDANKSIEYTKREIAYTKERIESEIKELDRLGSQYKEEKAKKFDESSAICPCCGQKMPLDRVSELKDKFLKEQKKNMDSAVSEGNKVKAMKESLENTLKELEETLKDKELAYEEVNNLLLDKENEIKNFKPTEVAETERLKSLKAEIEKNNAEKESLPKDIDEQISNHKATIIDLNNKLEECIKKIAQADRNKEIDEQIQKLVSKKIELEQNKANAEKILYQLDLVSRAKNETLADDINSHFAFVKFVFFEYQKNGNYKECCKVTVDCKELGVATNTALEVEAKVDICRGIQRYLECNTPIFVDNAECLDSKNLDAYNLESQLVFLKVTDDELKVGE